MKILWVSLYPPLPLNFGGPIGIYKRLLELRKYNDIYLFYMNEEENAEYDLQLEKLCKEVHSYRRNRPYNVETLKNIFKYPYTAASRVNAKMQADISKCIEENEIDLINAEFPQMCLNLIDIKNRNHIPIVLHEHNNEWNRFRQMADTVSGIKKLMYIREFKMLYKVEKKIEEKGIVDHYTFLSDIDMNNFRNAFGIIKDKLSLVPLGADKRELPSIEHEGKNIIFCAAMDSELNQEAAFWFVEKVFCNIKKKIPQIKFFLVGRNPNEKIGGLASDDVIVTGTVDDLEKYYAIADLVVIPLLHGGGVKVKLLEAVGYGKNIVTTSVGIEGTAFNSETQIPVCDDPQKFADTCVEILNNSNFALSLRVNTEKFFMEHYTWEHIGEDYNLKLKEVLKGFPS